MNTNKIVIIFTIICCMFIVGVPTTYKVIKSNHERLHIVTDKLITEAAEKCFYEGKCDSNNITLKELYDKKYLQNDIIDPVSKEVYNDSSYILVEKEKSTFYPV